MSNQKRLKEYLIGENGYLKSDISNGKVIMLSGKWGSGKTYFWQNIIQTALNGEDKKIPNHYISLYGKTSIQEIKNEVFLKVFESVDSFASEEKAKKVAKDSLDLVSSLTKSISVFGMSLDLSKITDKSFEKIDTLLNDEKLKRTETYLNSGAIICFDDFERKSKDINLNDLFGFITQLTLNFSCKVVIILNDDVFEGEEKDIFSRVKEKSVSKFLKYEPSIEKLFEIIFTNDERYRVIDEHKELILKIIEKTEELNARTYIQVLDNIVEWIDKKQEISGDILRCLILVNINFILRHTIITLTNQGKAYYESYRVKGFVDLYTYEIGRVSLGGYIQSFDDYHNLIIDKLISKEKTDTYNQQIINFINNNILIYKTYYFAILLNVKNNLNIKEFNTISSFIETGILIDE